jgi:protein-tyrosine-phosphatase
MAAIRNILFVCTGNTCRSVIAEHLGRKFCGDVFTFESSGIRPQTTADAANAVYVLRSTFGIDASGHRPRDVRETNIQAFDLVIAFGRDVADVVEELGFPKSRILVWEIQDPWDDNLAKYDETALKIRQCLARLKQERGYDG